MEQVTGRGTSTVYRWLSGETEPDLSDAYRLLVGLTSMPARQAILGLIVADLPVVVQWQGAEQIEAAHQRASALGLGRSPLDMTLSAMGSLTAGLAELRRLDALPAGEADHASVERAIVHLDDAMDSLMTSRNGLREDGDARRRAR